MIDKYLSQKTTDELETLIGKMIKEGTYSNFYISENSITRIDRDTDNEMILITVFNKVSYEDITPRYCMTLIKDKTDKYLVGKCVFFPLGEINFLTVNRIIKDYDIERGLEKKYLISKFGISKEIKNCFEISKKNITCNIMEVL